MEHGQVVASCGALKWLEKNFDIFMLRNCFAAAVPRPRIIIRTIYIKLMRYCVRTLLIHVKLPAGPIFF